MKLPEFFLQRRVAAYERQFSLNGAAGAEI